MSGAHAFEGKSFRDKRDERKRRVDGAQYGRICVDIVAGMIANRASWEWIAGRQISRYMVRCMTRLARSAAACLQRMFSIHEGAWSSGRAP